MKKHHQWVIERHAYAPEMNKAYRIVNGKRILIAKATGGLTTTSFDGIKSVRERFRSIKKGIIATVKTHYPPEFKWLERTHSGYVETRAQALAFAAELRTKLAEGGSVSVKTCFIG